MSKPTSSQKELEKIVSNILDSIPTRGNQMEYGHKWAVDKLVALIAKHSAQQVEEALKEIVDGTRNPEEAGVRAQNKWIELRKQLEKEK